MDVNITIRHVFERTLPRNILDSVTFVIISLGKIEEKQSKRALFTATNRLNTILT